MSYVIMKDNRYVRTPGTIRNFTGLYKYARKYKTRREAEQHKCIDEIIVEVNDDRIPMQGRA